jgi:hypothetical protein
MFSIFCPIEPEKRTGRADGLNPAFSRLCPQNIEQQDFILYFPLSE